MSEANQEKEFEEDEKLIDDMPSPDPALKSGAPPEGTSAMRNAETTSAPDEKSSENRSGQSDDSPDQLTQLKSRVGQI